jgi:hypothetical protein
MKAFLIACCILLLSTGFDQAHEQKAGLQADHTFDSSTPLVRRLTSPPDSVRQRYQASPDHPLAFHQVTEAERARLESVLGELPAFTRQIFAQHVRSISFVDGIPGNAITITEDGSTLPVFDIVLRTGLRNENVSQFLTRKERGYYTADGSNLTLDVEAGSLPAVLYVLLHESVHVQDISNRAGQDGMPRLFRSRPSNRLVLGIWENATTRVPAYRSPLLQVGWFGSGGPKGIESAESAYRLLAQTPFVSMYASSNWYDDAADLVTCYYLTQKLHQPYRIVLRRGTETLYAFSPMQGALVRARFSQITPLFG